MKPRNTADLLQKLTERTEANLAAGQEFLALESSTLHQRPRPDAWNALECLAHLNHYGDFYLPEIQTRIKETKHDQPADTFTSSWLGNKFAAGMKPGEKTREITTFKSADPRNSEKILNHDTVQEFIRQQEEILKLLQQARSVNLTRTKTGISISNLIKLRLGDTLRVVIYHNWRHVVQAQRAVGAGVAA
ncbi:DinB family protein [Neolewinella persica]|uniref:DinB family protein n=1 Tax=Neolewinella persica TaxID=70998 RepID=UPI00037DC55F|nr:DinB family protein [Neolewinella persica]